MMKLLITGFDAFGKDIVNPSFEAVSALQNQINNLEIVKVQLPTEFIRAKDNLIQQLDIHKPDYVILCGQAAGRKEISLERVAINIMDARIKDNAGYQPIDEEVITNAENAYFTNYDIRKMESACLNKNIPCKISYSAGTYVCNSTYFTLMNWISTNSPNTKGIFIHVPITPTQISNYTEDTFSMELSQITQALKVIIESL